MKGKREGQFFLKGRKIDVDGLEDKKTERKRKIERQK